MVVIDMAARINPKVRVFTIDTGRLPEETHQMMETVRQRYGIPVEIVFPEAAEVESMIATHGPNLFYREVALRKLCCQIRKVRPLERKLATLSAWVVGLRRSQTESRAEIAKVESRDGTVKISPLADWSSQQVEDYIRQHDVPGPSALRQRFSEHRLRSLHARHVRLRRRARRPLVVGAGRRERVRHPHHAQRPCDAAGGRPDCGDPAGSAVRLRLLSGFRRTMLRAIEAMAATPAAIR